MILIEVSRARQLLHISYIGHVQLSDFQDTRREMDEALAELPAGYRLVTDMSHLETMDLECSEQVGATMERLNQKGISAVVRVIPEPARDIGLNILSAFHYDRRVRQKTCRSLEEALQALQTAGSSPSVPQTDSSSQTGAQL